MNKVSIYEQIDVSGRSFFSDWFECLDAVSAAKVTTALYRLKQGNISNVKSVGPGYRVYFGRDGKYFIILLGGGAKKRQREDIKLAKKRWQEYKTYNELRGVIWH